MKPPADIASIRAAAAGAAAAEAPKTEASPCGRFFVRVGELPVTAPRFLIRDLVEQDSLLQIWGDSATYKSFIAYDMACCIATKAPYHGHEIENGGSVLCIIGEGRGAIGRRFRAWEIYRGISLKDAPIFVSQMPTGLTDPEQVKFVGSEIRHLAETHGNPALIIIDTLARNFGPGDENSTRDMTAAIAACDQLRAPYHAALAVVHHTGVLDKTRARGNGALHRALDAEYRTSIDQDGIVRFEATKMKDAPLPPPMAFEPVVVDLGLVDNYMRPVTSVAMEQVPFEAPPRPVRVGRGKWQVVAIDTLTALLDGQRQRMTDIGLDPDTARVSMEDLRRECLAKGMNREAWRQIKNNPPPGMVITNGYVDVRSDMSGLSGSLGET